MSTVTRCLGGSFYVITVISFPISRSRGDDPLASCVALAGPTPRPKHGPKACCARFLRPWCLESIIPFGVICLKRSIWRDQCSCPAADPDAICQWRKMARRSAGDWTWYSMWRRAPRPRPSPSPLTYAVHVHTTSRGRRPTLPLSNDDIN